MHEKKPRKQKIRDNSLKRREAARQETRQSLLDAAIRLFEENGYEGFSLRQVAEATGYTPTSIYLYFKDKDELLFSVCSRGFEEFTQTQQNAYESHTEPLARLRAMAVAYVDFGLGRPLHYRVMFLERAEWIAKASQSGKPGSGPESFQGLVSAVAQAQTAGWRSGIPLLDAAQQLWAGLHGIVSLSLSMRGYLEGWTEAGARRTLAGFLEAWGL